MRYLLILLVLLFVPVGSASAQQEPRTFNRTATGNNTPVFNTSGGVSGTRGPLSLRQMLQGNNNAADGNRSSSYYGGKNFRPYGVDNNNYSLALSPQEIQASRDKRNALARQREAENLAAIARSEQFDDPAEQARSLGNATQPVSRNPLTLTGRKRFKQRDDGFEIPPKVFNSVR